MPRGASVHLADMVISAQLRVHIIFMEKVHHNTVLSQFLSLQAEQAHLMFSLDLLKTFFCLFLGLLWRIQQRPSSTLHTLATLWPALCWHLLCCKYHYFSLQPYIDNMLANFNILRVQKINNI
jgi:hypothetical protein